MLKRAGIFIAAAVVSAAPQPTVNLRYFPSALKLEPTCENSANVSIGDLDGDGDLDLLLAKGRHTPLVDRVLLNSGRATFTATDLSPTADRTYSAVLADIDGDGDLDVLVSNDTPDRKIIYLNDGKARFRIAGTWGVPEWSTRNAAVADLNGDGKPDVIAANRPGPSYVCLNDGAGGFRTPCTAIPISSATSVVPADFNNDGAVDLAVPHRDGGQSLIFINDGHANFARTIAFGPPSAAARVAAAADFNGDGWQDLVMGDERAASMTVYLNDRNGGFSPGFQVTDRARVPYAIEAGDLNRDGRPDIVIGYLSSRSAVFFNDGSGRQFVDVRFGDGQGDAYGFALGDLNGDHYSDIALARTNAPNVVYLSADRASAGDSSSSTARMIGPSLIGGFDQGRVESAFGCGWRPASDEISGGRSQSVVALASGGARGSAGSLRVEGEIAPSADPWAGATFWPATGIMATANLSTVKRLSFWAKGDGRTYRVSLASPGSPRAEASMTFVAGPDWREHAFDLSDFRGVDTQTVLWVTFAAGSPPGRFAFQIDDVRLQ